MRHWGGACPPAQRVVLLASISDATRKLAAAGAFCMLQSWAHAGCSCWHHPAPALSYPPLPSTGPPRDLSSSRGARAETNRRGPQQSSTTHTSIQVRPATKENLGMLHWAAHLVAAACMRASCCGGCSSHLQAAETSGPVDLGPARLLYHTQPSARAFRCVTTSACHSLSPPPPQPAKTRCCRPPRSDPPSMQRMRCRCSKTRRPAAAAAAAAAARGGEMPA